MARSLLCSTVEIAVAQRSLEFGHQLYFSATLLNHFLAIMNCLADSRS
jgi:hypothetical protein